MNERAERNTERETRTDTGFLRTLYHLLGVIIPTLYLTIVTDRFLVSTILACIFLGFLIGDILRFTVPPWNRLVATILKGFIKPDEDHRFNGSTYYFFSATLVVYFLHPYIAATSIFMLSIGDPSACLVGRRWGTVKAFGGPKSLQGFLALFFSAFLVGLILLPWQISVVGAFVAGVTEIFPFHYLFGRKLACWFDDNATIPLASGWAMTGVALLARWSG